MDESYSVWTTSQRSCSLRHFSTTSHRRFKEELRCFLIGRKVNSVGMSVQGCGCCRVLAWERHGVYGNQVEFWSLNWPQNISKGRILVKTETTSVKPDFGRKGWGCFIRVKLFLKSVTECALLTLGPRTLEPAAWVQAWLCTWSCVCNTQARRGLCTSAFSTVK